MKRTEHKVTLRAMGAEGLREKIGTLNKDLMSFRFRKQAGQLDKSSVIRAARRELARAKTILREQGQVS